MITGQTVVEDMSCLVGVLTNTPHGVKRSGLGAPACWDISYVSKLV